MSKNWSVQRLDTLRSEIGAARVLRIPWRTIAASYPGVPPGTLCAVYKGREPKKPAIRRALGLPMLVAAPACPHCGAPPHPHRNCPARANGRGKPHLPGVSLSDNPAVTARSIRRHMGSSYIWELWTHERRHWWAISGDWIP